MKKFLRAAAILVAIGTPASADVTYDRSIDEAAARILADRIGEIRGSFGPGEEPVFVPDSRAEITGSAGGVPRGLPKGLVRARDPATGAPISF